MVLCTHHNPGTQGSGSGARERAWAGCLGWSRGDSVCGDFSEGHSRPLSQTALVLAPKTVHPPPAQTDKLLPKPAFSAPPLVFTLAVPWAWHPCPFLCTKLLPCLRAQLRCHLLQPVECLLPSNFLDQAS